MTHVVVLEFIVYGPKFPTGLNSSINLYLLSSTYVAGIVLVTKAVNWTKRCPHRSYAGVGEDRH